MSSGTLEKLVIQAYRNADYSESSFIDQFESYVNPNEITLGYEMEYDSAQGSGTTNSRMNFKKQKPGDMSLSFFLDGTGANGRPLDVQQAIQKFQSVTGFNGDIHRPNYLLLNWGTLSIKRCVLKNASIAYKMFRSNGVPLRAVINASFTDNSDDNTRVAIEQKQSPDLTHRRVFKAGDNLPAICREIYGDPSYYLRVAQANQIVSFRQIPTGTELFFPPLEK